MDWSRVVLNLVASTFAGVLAVIALTPACWQPSRTAALIVVSLPILTNVLGLFQTPPHEKA